MVDGGEILQIIEHVSSIGQSVVVGKRLVEVHSGDGIIAFAIVCPTRIVVYIPRQLVFRNSTRSLLLVIVERQGAAFQHSIRLLRLRGISEVARIRIGVGDVVGIAVAITDGTNQLVAPGEHVRRVSHVARIPVLVAVDSLQIR